MSGEHFHAPLKHKAPVKLADNLFTYIAAHECPWYCITTLPRHLCPLSSLLFVVPDVGAAADAKHAEEKRRENNLDSEE